MSDARTDTAQRSDIWITVLVLGSLWGFTEVVLSGAISAAGLPYRSAILTGIGMGLMAVAFGAFKRPWMLVATAFVAVLCKQLVVPILQVSMMCKANSCVAVMIEGLALAGTVVLVGRRVRKGNLARIATGSGTALLAAVAFLYIGVRVAPCQYLLNFLLPGGLGAFMTAEAIPWAITSGLLFPVGYWIGERLAATDLALGSAKRRTYYAASTAVIAVCWLASAFAIAAGY